MTLRTCVSPKRQFHYGIHKPSYTSCNLRAETEIHSLGHLDSGACHHNQANFPETDVQVDHGDWIFEIPNPLSFRGSTFIAKEWADHSADTPLHIRLPPQESLSLSQLLSEETLPETLFDKLPGPLLLTLATTSTDPKDLIRLAERCCDIEKNDDGIPCGLIYSRRPQRLPQARIRDHALFEAVANNPALPDSYKRVMVLRPGAQGGSEIVGEFRKGEASHVFEYLRRNSYIAGGHYAANMADDAIRYTIDELSLTDITGMRHLYYQRSFVRLATHLGITIGAQAPCHSADNLETLRQTILTRLAETGGNPSGFSATLWGWNFGFDYAPSHYRLHASHQQVHQQYAMLPQEVAISHGSLNTTPNEAMASFGCGDMVAEVIQSYRAEHECNFFDDYLACIHSNRRMDERTDLSSSLILWQDPHALLFVPKAQTSQWELQLMALNNTDGSNIGNILEADTAARASLDRGILMAQKALAGLGAKMVTSIEYPKRIGNRGEDGQHLLHSFLPKLPESPGAFSEAQLRFINGHYPEDFAAACRQQLSEQGWI